MLIELQNCDGNLSNAHKKRRIFFSSIVKNNFSEATQHGGKLIILEGKQILVYCCHERPSNTQENEANLLVIFIGLKIVLSSNIIYFDGRKKLNFFWEDDKIF